MKRTAICGLILCTALLASPVFAANDLCESNLQKAEDSLKTLTTSENTDGNLATQLQEAKDAQAAGNDQKCIDITTKMLQRLENITKGGS